MAYANPVQWLDWRPDDDPRRPGVITDVDGMFPTTKGMMANPSWLLVGGATLNKPVTGGISWQLQSGFWITVVGTDDQLYKYLGSSQTLVPWGRANPGNYQSKTRWRFAVFQNNTLGLDILIAVNGRDVPQVSQNGGQFQDLGPPFTLDGSYAPVASLVETVSEGVFLAGLGPAVAVGQQSGYPNQWAFTANPRIWNASTATETVSDFLVGTVGPITAMHRIRGGIVMYKPQSFYMGQFTSPPFFWNFGQAISENIGASSNEMVVSTGDLHVWAGPDDFYQFDSSSLQPVPNYVKEWFTAHVSEFDRARMLGEYLREWGIVRWYYPGTPTTDPLNPTPLDSTLIYGVRAGQKWMKCDPELHDAPGQSLTIEAIIQPVFKNSSSLSYIEWGQQVDALGGTYLDQPDLAYDNPTWGTDSAGVEGAVVSVGGVNQVATETGEPIGGFWKTGELGDGANYYQLSRIRLLYASIPTPVHVRASGFVGALNGVPPTIRETVSMLADGAINLIQTGVIHRLKFIQTGPGEVTSVMYDMTPAGEE